MHIHMKFTCRIKYPKNNVLMHMILKNYINFCLVAFLHMFYSSVDGPFYFSSFDVACSCLLSLFRCFHSTFQCFIQHIFQWRSVHAVEQKHNGIASETQCSMSGNLCWCRFVCLDRKRELAAWFRSYYDIICLSR